MQTNNVIENIDNNPTQFTCPVCGCHELVLVETHIVHYTIVRINESGKLEYEPTPFSIEGDGDPEDCYFACACYCPGYRDGDGRSDCDFTPNDPEDDSDVDRVNNRIGHQYTMLQWIKDHQETPAVNNNKNSGGQVPQDRTEESEDL
jgi:hypothetical protein